MEDSSILKGSIKPLVVVVDDDKNYLDAAKELIETMGYPVLKAQGPLEAIPIVNGLTDGAIFLIDYDMPDMSGIRLIKYLRQIERLPMVIIFVTGYEDHAIFIEALESGADGYFSKCPPEGGEPYNLGDLYKTHIAKAEYVLRKWRAPRLDALTGQYGVYDREGVKPVWEYIHKRAKRDRSPISLLFLDVNGLGKVNEINHSAGDELLRGFAKSVSLNLLRDSDTFVRTGGDEFVLILPDTPRSGAVKVLQGLRKKIREISIEIAPGLMTDVTVSAGVSCLTASRLGDDANLDFKTLVKAANALERRNKRHIRKLSAEKMMGNNPKLLLSS